MNRKYRNKEWLYDKYINKKLSTTQIGKICGIKNVNIWKWLKRLNIPVRSRGYAIHLVTGNHCDLSKEAIEWINGELLGDGCLCSRSKQSARFTYTSQYKEYIEYIKNTLITFGILGITYEHKNKKTNKYDKCYKSRAYVELLPIYKQWYPEKKKIVPKDVELTPLTCRQWYIGDGSLAHKERKYQSIILCTCGFSINDVDYLVIKLSKMGFTSTRQPSVNMIHILSCSTINFLNYVGGCPVSCYQYKWG